MFCTYWGWTIPAFVTKTWTRAQEDRLCHWSDEGSRTCFLSCLLSPSTKPPLDGTLRPINEKSFPLISNTVTWHSGNPSPYKLCCTLDLQTTYSSPISQVSDSSLEPRHIWAETDSLASVRCGPPDHIGSSVPRRHFLMEILQIAARNGNVSWLPFPLIWFQNRQFPTFVNIKPSQWFYMALKKSPNLVSIIEQIFMHVNFIDIFSLIFYTHWIWTISLECCKAKWKLNLLHKKALMVPRMKRTRWWHHTTGHGTPQRQPATAASAAGGLRLVGSGAMHSVQKKILWEKLNCKHHWSLLSQKTVGNFYQLWIPAGNPPPFKSSTCMA